MTRTADFTVIGAGIAGASVAYELARHGSVALLEQEPQPGHHTTSRSAATWIEGYETGIVRELTVASRDHITNPPDGFTDVALAKQLAIMLIAREDQLEALDAAAAQDTRGFGTARLDGPGAVQACPALREDYVAGALIEEDSLDLDVHALHQGFLNGARARGAELLTAAPVHRLERNGTGWAVGAGAEAISSGMVVNAAGAWADEIAQLAGIAPVGLSPLRRTAFAFKAPSGVDTTGWAMPVDVNEEFYFKPEGTQFMGCLAEETPMQPHDVRPDEIDVALAIDRINAATTFAIRHVVRAWAGLRTFAPDRQPVVGLDPGGGGFFWLAGQGGYGIMTAPAMARLACSLAVGEGVPDDLAARGVTSSAVSPDRFAS